MQAGAMRAGAVLAGIGAMLLAGCGGAGPSAPERSATATAAQMKKAVQAASSVHVDGVLRSGGKALGLDIGLVSSGEFAGTITENGIPLTLIDTSRKIYVKATPAFLQELKVPASVCSIICGKYVEMPAAQGDALAGNLSMPVLLASLTGKLPKFTNAGTTTVGGRPAQILRGPDGSRLDVAAVGTPYPLQAVGKRNNARLDFTQWNAVPKPTAPPAGRVINIGSLGD